MTKVLDSSSSSTSKFKFDSSDNQCRTIDSNQIVALARDKKHVMHMIRYTLSENQFKILKTFEKARD